ncbi:hypothetical protein HKX48_001323, partial [Thoreauomyces humboldtii]
VKMAATGGHIWVLMRLFQDKRVTGYDLALQRAAVHGREATVRYLLEVSPKDTDLTLPLLVACRQGHCSVVSLLLHAGVDPSVREDRAFRTACQENHLDCAKTLMMDPRVDASTRMNEALRTTVQFKDIQKLLLKDPRVREKWGMRPEKDKP